MPVSLPHTRWSSISPGNTGFRARLFHSDHMHSHSFPHAPNVPGVRIKRNVLLHPQLDATNPTRTNFRKWRKMHALSSIPKLTFVCSSVKKDSSDSETNPDEKIECMEDENQNESNGNELNQKELNQTSQESENETPRESFFSGKFLGFVLFLALLSWLLFSDALIWRIVQHPLSVFFLTLPFLLSTAISSLLGILSIPILKHLKASQIVRREGPQSHLKKEGTPTMGGFFFIPVGFLVPFFVTGAPPELCGVAFATFAFAMIGLLDDFLILIRRHNDGLPGKFKFLLQVVASCLFLLWMNAAPLSSPYNMKSLIPLPPPFGLWYIGLLYPFLSIFCFTSMSNGVNLTDGLDGLAAGTSAIAFISMAISVIAVYPALAVFGASMAGACMGFLTHNRHKASVFMGDVGSLALGGALAAMAVCSGMFFPLFIASFVFVLETLSVVVQVSYFKITKRLNGEGSRLLLMSPLHHHLELSGLNETQIIALAYAASLVTGILAAYLGLASA